MICFQQTNIRKKLVFEILFVHTNMIRWHGSIILSRKKHRFMVWWEHIYSIFVDRIDRFFFCVNRSIISMLYGSIWMIWKYILVQQKQYLRLMGTFTFCKIKCMEAKQEYTYAQIKLIRTLYTSIPKQQ